MNRKIHKKNTMIYPLRPVDYVFDKEDFMYGAGLRLYDNNGKEYIDGISGLWNVSLGYADEKINEAIMNQLRELQYVNLICSSTALNRNYSDRLVSLTDDIFTKSIYVCSGSESVECAVKAVRKYFRILNCPQKSKIIIFDMSYHGTTYAAMSASGMDYEESLNYGPTVPGFIRVKAPFVCQRESEPDIKKKEILSDLERVMESGDQIAAFLIEPVIGSGGIIVIPEWYLKEIKKYMKQKDILLICDEVATGFGRTGSLFAYMQLGIKPDILCLAKGIDNGSIPMGITLLGDRIVKAYQASGQHMEHFSTQMGNPMACAAAMEVLYRMEDSLTLSHINETGNYLKARLQLRIGSLPVVREIRGIGLMLGIDLADEDGKPLKLEKLFELEAMMREGGLLVYPFCAEPMTGGISLFPAYCITMTDADKIVHIIEQKLKRFAVKNGFAIKAGGGIKNGEDIHKTG